MTFSHFLLPGDPIADTAEKREIFRSTSLGMSSAWPAGLQVLDTTCAQRSATSFVASLGSMHNSISRHQGSRATMKTVDVFRRLLA
jgi:hypothetical protein